MSDTSSQPTSAVSEEWRQRLKLLPAWAMLLVGIFSGVLSGILNWRLFNLATTQLSSDPWVFSRNFAPGCIFGILIALTRIVPSAIKRLDFFISDINRIILALGVGIAYTVVSGLIWWLAYGVGFWGTNVAHSFVLGGFIAGCFGGFVLSVTMAIAGGFEVKRDHVLRTTLIGGLAGSLFLVLLDSAGNPLPFGSEHPFGNPASADMIGYWCLVFALWQGAVGWSLSYGLAPTSPVKVEAIVETEK